MLLSPVHCGRGGTSQPDISSLCKFRNTLSELSRGHFSLFLSHSVFTCVYSERQRRSKKFTKMLSPLSLTRIPCGIMQMDRCWLLGSCKASRLSDYERNSSA